MKYQLGALGAIKALDLIMSTCNVKMHGLDHLIYTLRSKSALLALWHNQLALAPYSLSPYLENTEKTFAAISASSDGNWMEAVVNHYPNTTSIRIAHTERSKAFQAFASALENRSLLVITPDGPKGPLHSVKPGILLTAKRTGSPILPFIWKGPHWKVNSWDSFRIPKPFSTIELHFGKPIYLTSTTSLEEDKTLLEHVLNF